MPRQLRRSKQKKALLPPWWLFLGLAFVSFFVLRSMALLEPARTRGPEVITTSLYIAIGTVGQVVVPIFLLVLAALLFLAKRGSPSRSDERPTAVTVLHPASNDNSGARDLYETWKEVDANDSAIDTTCWSLGLLRALEWKRFEQLCSAYFESLHFRSESATIGPDGGIDIHLYAEGATTPGFVVQCKAWRNYKVGVKPVRELLGVMFAKKIPEGIFITSSEFTGEAREFAAGNNLHLIDGREFLSKITNTSAAVQQALLKLATDGDFSTPTCPSCGLKMIVRTAANSGSRFWGCRSFPTCRGTIAIGTRPLPS